MLARRREQLSTEALGARSFLRRRQAADGGVENIDYTYPFLSLGVLESVLDDLHGDERDPIDSISRSCPSLETAEKVKQERNLEVGRADQR